MMVIEAGFFSRSSASFSSSFCGRISSSRRLIRSSSNAVSGVMPMGMLLFEALDDEFEHVALLARGDQLVSGRAAERLEVLHCARIGGVDLEQSARRHALQG